MTPDQLRRIAEAATPGPWELDKCDNRVHVDYVRAPNDENLIAPICAVSSPGPNAEFIATFNPKRILELLDENERLESVVREQARILDGRGDRLAAVEKLHYAIDDGACAHCDDMFKYPCPTLKAVRGE